LSAVERKLEILKAWFDLTRWSLNVFFGSLKDIPEDVKIKVCDVEIEIVHDIELDCS